MEFGAPTKHNGLCQGVQVEHRAHCGAVGMGGGGGWGRRGGELAGCEVRGSWRD